MVAVIRSPAQRQFRQIACSYNNSILAIGDIHQDLCTLAGLRVLIGNIMLLRVLANILKMLGNRLGDANLTDGDAQLLHKRNSIVVRTVGSSEARHRDTDNTVTVET